MIKVCNTVMEKLSSLNWLATFHTVSANKMLFCIPQIIICLYLENYHVNYEMNEWSFIWIHVDFQLIMLSFVFNDVNNDTFVLSVNNHIVIKVKWIF